MVPTQIKSSLYVVLGQTMYVYSNFHLNPFSSYVEKWEQQTYTHLLTDLQLGNRNHIYIFKFKMTSALFYYISGYGKPRKSKWNTRI